MPVPPIFVCVNIFQARILAEHKFNNAWFNVAEKTALITGGGIGAFMATARSITSANLILIGRRQDWLEAVLA